MSRIRLTMNDSRRAGSAGRISNLESRISRVCAGFTLVELLITIGIIAVLAGLLIPAVHTVMRKAEEAQARADVSALATAVKAYINEYGKFPEGSGLSDRLYHGDTPANYNARLINPLRSVTGVGNGDGTNNPRRVVFLEVAGERIVTNGPALSIGSYLDVWDNQYRIILDTDFDGHCIADAAGRGRAVSNRNVVVWSIGRDAVHNTGDDIKSWE